MNEWVSSPYLFQARRPLEIRGFRKPWHWFKGLVHRAQFHNHFWQRRIADTIVRRSDELAELTPNLRDRALNQLRMELRTQPDNTRLHRETFA